MIRKATAVDIDAILNITKACARYMIAKGIYQWNEDYPNKDAFIKDVNREELYVIENNNDVVGCIVVSSYMDEEYKSVKWLTPNNGNIYIHRLAIDPASQGLGYAQKLIVFAEALAIKKNYTSIRLDTFSQNLRNQKFYDLRGYERLGEIYFLNQSEYPFYCYELIL